MLLVFRIGTDTMSLIRLKLNFWVYISHVMNIKKGLFVFIEKKLRIAAHEKYSSHCSFDILLAKHITSCDNVSDTIFKVGGWA